MENRVIENAIQFLQRIDLKASEAFAFCEVVNELQKLKEGDKEELDSTKE